MTPENLISHATKGPVAKRMLVGAGLGLILISVFLLNAEHVDPEWGKFYWIRPIIIVPVAGAMGGFFYHLITPLRYRGGWQKIVAITLSLIVYIIELWLGFVLGLDGTYWN